MSFLLYSLYIVSYFLHLPSRIPALGMIRLDFLLMGAIIVFIMLDKFSSGSEKKGFTGCKTLVFLIGYIIFTLPLVEWPGSVARFGLINFSKVIFFYFFTISILTTEKRLKVFIFIFLLCQTIRILEPGYLHLTTDYWGSTASSFVGGESVLNRLSGAPHDVVNPNQLAWIIVSTLLFIFYLVWKAKGIFRYTAILLAPAFIYVLILTGSRSGLLSLLIVIIAISVLGKNKFKRIIIISLVTFTISVVVVQFLNTDLLFRYESIINSNVAGGDTAEKRVGGLEKTFSTVSHHPIFGHGLGTSGETNYNVLGGSDQITHNLYIEILQELGLVGFIIFILYLKEIIVLLIQTKKILVGLPSEHSWLLNLVTAIQAWIIMDLFYSLSSFGLSSWEWYLFGGISIACVNLAKIYYQESKSGRLEKDLTDEEVNDFIIKKGLRGIEWVKIMEKQPEGGLK